MARPNKYCSSCKDNNELRLAEGYYLWETDRRGKPYKTYLCSFCADPSDWEEEDDEDDDN